MLKKGHSDSIPKLNISPEELTREDKIFNQVVKQAKKELTERNIKSKRKEMINKKLRSLTKDHKRQRVNNLQTLGVIDISRRLSRGLGKKKTLKSENIPIYVSKRNPNLDRLGGKLICNQEVLGYRIDRSIFINCMNEYKDKKPFDFKTYFINYSLMNIKDFDMGEIPKTCKVKLAVSLNSYHKLANCLIIDKKEGGFFKFRNSNSLGYQFDIIKEK